MDQSYL